MISPSGVDRDLGELERAGLIQLAATEPELEYLIRHVLVQDAAYESLLRQDRRTLHRAVADVLERLYPDRLEELAPIMGFHLERAGEAERAVPYLVSAGHHALQRFAQHEARDFFERASALLPASDDPATRRHRVEIDLRRVEAGIDFTPADQELAILGARLADAEALDDPRLMAEVWLLTALVRTLRGEQYGTSQELSEALDRSLELTADDTDPELRGLPLAIVGEARYKASEFREASRLLDEAVPLLAVAGRTSEASLFAGTLALAHARVGEFGEADRWIVRSTELAQQSGNPATILDADLDRAVLESLRGNTTLAIDYASTAAEQADRIDNKACAIVARSVIAEQHLLSDRPAEAIPVLEKVADLAEYCDLVPARVEVSRALLDSARARAGVQPPSVDVFDRALEFARAIGDRLSEGELLRQRARDRLAAGEPLDPIVADFEASAGIFEAIGARPDLARTIGEHGLALIHRGQVDAGQRLIQDAGRHNREMGILAVPLHDTADAH